MTTFSVHLGAVRTGRLRKRVPAPTRAALAGVLAACLVLGAAVAVLPWPIVLGALVASAVVGIVVIHPPAAAYLLLAITPLVAGIDRGVGVPFLRPTEALAALVGVGLLGRGVLLALRSGVPALRPSTMDITIVALLVTGSILPFLWMLARGIKVTSDDLLYGLVLWKFFGIYLIFRFSIKTEPEVRRCLWIVMITGSLVAVIAIMQAMGVHPVTAFVTRYYSQYGDSTSALNSRGGATFGLPIALADFMLLDLAIAAGFLLISRERRALFLMAGLFIGGVFASAEFSALIGLLVAVVALAIIARRRAIVLYIIPALCLAVFVLRPVIEQRLLGFQSVSGLPVSWTGRLHNLTSYFWPELFSNDHFLLGVRLSARVVVPTQATGYVWIESGYTWLLWSGGIPFLLAFCWFVGAGIRRGVAAARTHADAVGIAGLAAATGLSVVAVLMLFDPHLTYRGAADVLFAMLALTAVGTTQAYPNS